MGIKLYRHNYDAYLKAEKMLEKNGRAAIIHPTGTGKSFIGFAFAEAHPEETFLWISPSEYIYKIQLQHVGKETTFEFSNIVFHTYAWLLYHQDAFLKLTADYIVLDEFHRAGARKWGVAVGELIKAKPSAKLLGFSATNIRYLDARRDIADELFKGCVASYMELSEAMGRRILPVPIYVISLYSHEHQLKLYENHIRRIRNRMQREESSQIFEKLRRCLEKALGIPEIFQKHLTNHNVKLLLFCTSKDHLMKMVSEAPVWFHLIDPYPHIYTVYSDNPEADEEFDKFQNDHSRHLRLLYCIDMLNEGVHVDDVDGVVLLRPTSSPTVYRQQIGRALAAGRTKTPIIFDFVNNFNSLYNIDILRTEFEKFQHMYAYLGQGSGTTSEMEIHQFQIFDELRSARKLFSVLQNSLSFSWDEYYQALVRYQEMTGSVEVPRRFVTENGLYLGRWLEHQKRKYREGRLGSEQASMLAGLGVGWEADRDRSFDDWVQLLCEYRVQFGDVKVPDGFIFHGKNLGRWCGNVRLQYKSGRLDAERVARLEAVGFVWAPVEALWENGYLHAKRYFERNRNLDVPKDYIDEDGYKLGLWIQTQRRVKAGNRHGNLDEEKIEKLEALGIRWNVGREDGFKKYLEAYKRFMAISTAKLTARYVTEDGLPLGRWVYQMKYQKAKGLLSEDKVRALDEIGFRWDIQSPNWMRSYEEAKAYYEEHGNLIVPEEYSSSLGTGLAYWVRKQASEYAKEYHGALSASQVAMLEEIHIEIRTTFDAIWFRGYQALKKYIEENGNSLVPLRYVTDDGFKLGEWVSRIKEKKRAGKLKEERERMLREIGMDFRSNFELKRAQAEIVKGKVQKVQEPDHLWNKEDNVEVSHSKAPEDDQSSG